MCVCVCVVFPFILDVRVVGRTSRGHTGGRSHRISHPPSFCSACLNFSREKDSAIPFPGRPWSRISCTNERFNRSSLFGHFLIILYIFLILCEKNYQLPRFELTSRRVRRFRGYQLSYRGDRLCLSPFIIIILTTAVHI